MPYKDPVKQREYVRQWVAQRRANWFADKACVRCGSTDRMELDHIDPTQKISHSIWSWSEARRNDELVKCQVLCYDCHKIKTAEYYKNNAKHGTYAMRNRYGCTCEACKEYVRESKRKSRARIKQRA